MPDLSSAAAMLADETGLAVVSSVQKDGRILSSVANCGLFDHPVSGEPRVTFVSMGTAARLDHIRRGSDLTIAIRRAWKWISVTGPAEIIGPDSLPGGMTPDSLRVLLRGVFHAAGGKHDDLDAYDRAMVDEGRVAVLVTPQRILGNG